MFAYVRTKLISHTWIQLLRDVRLAHKLFSHITTKLTMCLRSLARLVMQPDSCAVYVQADPDFLMQHGTVSTGVTTCCMFNNEHSPCSIIMTKFESANLVDVAGSHRIGS